jgi:hypothetical protein
VISFDLDAPLMKVLGFLEREIGPRKFWLHSKIGGDGWTVDFNYGNIRVTMPNNQMATYVKLKFK